MRDMRPDEGFGRLVEGVGGDGEHYLFDVIIGSFNALFNILFTTRLECLRNQVVVIFVDPPNEVA
jgi:hypothetical protein